MNEHSYHTRFFFLNIKKLNQSISEELLKVPFFLENLFYMLLPELEFILFNDKHSSHASTSICVDLDFSFVDISTNRIFFW
jgi:predicted lactoylglutathione lyase